jgi:hypothetical protein
MGLHHPTDTKTMRLSTVGPQLIHPQHRSIQKHLTDAAEKWIKLRLWPFFQRLKRQIAAIHRGFTPMAACEIFVNFCVTSSTLSLRSSQAIGLFVPNNKKNGEFL